MKTNTLLISALISSFLISAPAFAAKAPAWDSFLVQDDVKIEKFEENAPNGQHNKFNFLVRFTNTKTKKTSEQALIKDLQEDWLESHTEYSFNDGVLTVSVTGTDQIAKGNGEMTQKPFKLQKCFRLNAAATNFAPSKCAN